MSFNFIEPRNTQWSELVMRALLQAKKDPEKLVKIHVGTAAAAFLIEEAIIQLISTGSEDAERIMVEQVTCH